MGDQETRPLSLEQKVDLILTRLDRLEAKQYDTKPIWERALAEIFEVKAIVDRTEGKLDRLNKRILDLEGEMGINDRRISDVENRITEIEDIRRPDPHDSR